MPDATLLAARAPRERQQRYEQTARRGTTRRLAVHHGSMPTGGAEQERYRFLLDTNVYIALEPFAGSVEPGLGPAADLVRLSNRQGHQLFVHPATADDLRQGTDAARLSQQLAELDKFESLDEGPIPTSLVDRAGASTPGTNDHRDLRILAALNARAVHYLISEDIRLRRRAARADLGQSVLTIAEATELLLAMEPTRVVMPPRVESIAAYALDREQSIFDSLRGDYTGFDLWMDHVQTDWQNRDAFVVRIPETDAYAALAILKRAEPDCVYGFEQPVTKLSTFKVDDAHAGSRYGELLLKSILSTASERGTATVYVEVLPRHEVLIDFLADFGFAQTSHATARGEAVLAKALRPRPAEPALPALAHHIAFGPPAVSEQAAVHVIPIQPRWHDQLFPDAPGADAPDQQLMLPGLAPVRTHPWGNAIRKAYLSGSRSRQLQPGDVLLFYRSHDRRTVSAVGVVERTLRTSDPVEIIAAVGGRTVYSMHDITEMCRSGGPVLVVIFRQDRFIDPAWEIGELQEQGVTRSWPQSITTVRGEGAAWVKQQLDASP